MAEEKRSIGYICPVCGQTVVAERPLFALLAGNSALPCPCGGSEVSFRQMGDRCEVTAPCVFCARDHRTVCSNAALRRERLIELTCGRSGMGICHIGAQTEVFRAARRLEAAVDRLREDPPPEGRGTFLNDAAMEEVLSELRDIAARGGVSCGCGSKDYGVKVGWSWVDVVCTRCGAAVRLPAAASEDVDGLCARYTLTIPGKKES